MLSFVRRMGRAPEKQSVVNTCISMSKNLDPRSYGVGKQQSRQREMYMSRGSRFKMAGQFHISSSKGTTINAFAFSDAITLRIRSTAKAEDEFWN